MNSETKDVPNPIEAMAGSGSYGVDSEKRGEARRLALEWFEEHLTKGNP